MKSAELSKIMTRAWAIKRLTNFSFSVCLSKSWQLYRLVKQMRQGAVGFTYKKKDGSTRKAFGTLRNAVLLVNGTGRATSPEVITYFDIQKQSFRCFRIENFVALN